MFQWLVENWEREYGLARINITLKYLYSVLPFWNITLKAKALQIQIEVCELLIDSKNYERFVCKNQKKELMKLDQHIYVYKNMIKIYMIESEREYKCPW